MARGVKYSQALAAEDGGTTYVDYSVETPEICGQSALCNALLTLGWRF